LKFRFPHRNGSNRKSQRYYWAKSAMEKCDAEKKVADGRRSRRAARRLYL
jgi:hypothetical protein